MNVLGDISLMIDFLYPLRFNPMFLIFWYTCILWLSVFSIIFIVLLAFGHLFFGFGYYAYLFCVVSTTAHGHREPPVFYHGIMQPFDDLRPYKLIMLVATFFVITSFLFANDLSLIAWIVIGVGVLAAPASIAVLSLEDNLLRAISPLLLIEIIKKLGKAYWISIGLFALSAFLVGLLFESEVGLFVSLFILLYSILLACRQIGFMIYHNRNHIGFEAEESPEARSAFDERLLVKQRYRFIDAAYSQRRQPGAVNVLLEAAAAEPDPLFAHAWYHHQLQEWENPQVMLEHACHYIRALRQAERLGEAELILQSCRQLEPGYHCE